MKLPIGAVFVALIPSMAVAQAKARQGSPQGSEGKVVAVASSSSQLVQLNIGSDANVEVGHMLHAYRLGNVPEYLGTVVITAVRAKASIGTFKPEKRDVGIKEGDRVAGKGRPVM